MSSKKFGLFTLIILPFALMVASCATPTQEPAPIEKPAAVVPASQEPATEMPATEMPATEEPEPISGGTVTVAVNREPDMLDPNVGSSRYDDQVHLNIFDTPLHRTADLKIVPGLVEEWTLDDTSTKWTLKLRQGVTFHDGTPFNAAALKFNFDRISNPETKSKKAAGLLSKVSTTVVDEYTVAMQYETPYGAFLDAMSTPAMGIVSPASVAKFGQDVGRNPVGTGPFKFVEWIAQDRIVLERNPEYNWAPSSMGHEGPAYIEQLIFRIIPEDVARSVALETGEIDALINLPREQVSRFKDDPAFAVKRAVVVGSPAMLVLNGTKFPTDDILVRKAIARAIKQDDLISAALFGVGTRAYGPISNSNPCYDPSLESKPGYNPMVARKLLLDAGWKDAKGDGILDKDGKPLAIEYITFGGAANRRTAEFIQAQLREVGIDLTIREMESPAIQPARQAGEHNLAWLTWLGMDPAVLDVMFHSRNIGKGWNFSHYPVAALDEMLVAGKVNTIAATRCKIYAKAQNIIMDEAMIVPMYAQEQVVAHSVAIQGLAMSAHGDYIVWYDAAKPE